MKEYIIETKDLYYHYPDGTQALKGISLAIEKGKKIAIIGVNGSGKSTLFLNLNGVLKATSGKIFYEGKELKYDKRSLMEVRKNVGIVFQNPESMLFSSNVFQEVSFGPMNLGYPVEEVKKQVVSSLEEVNMLEFQEKSVHFLSYGQKKRVSIADILAMKPKVMILDEPTSSLDPRHTRQLKELFEDLHRKGITVIISTHDVNLAYEWADEILVMKDGKVVEFGASEEIFVKKELLFDCYLEQPYLVSLYEELKKKGVLQKIGKLPKTQKELLEMV
ncbi:cobalt ABC transporter, ATP-binding protein [Fusobacterium gonidiaformans 3-1-5R]|uniref:ABC transporter ATP-binding protein n=2 Tax=Fusobacterium TaxID=848 RepID=E5BEI1_9FUSO|nr:MULTISPECIES: ATP-binding cassette domain-containing protein [Fusobacterium]EFS20512.1 cobalt ABC transporter, ATP-binding protein [Fusobacterium gonidiaformans 3-1-5R]KXA13858.1 cobalt ABC transporter, ATP-binding protein [Fusobacterium equinum]